MRSASQGKCADPASFQRGIRRGRRPRTKRKGRKPPPGPRQRGRAAGSGSAWTVFDGFFFLAYIYRPRSDPIRLRTELMKSAVREARLHASGVQSVSPERLHSARTVPQRVPRALSRRLLEVVGFEDLAKEVPVTEHQRGVAHVRPALKVGYVVDQFPRATH